MCSNISLSVMDEKKYLVSDPDFNINLEEFETINLEKDVDTVNFNFEINNVTNKNICYTVNNLTPCCISNIDNIIKDDKMENLFGFQENILGIDFDVLDNKVKNNENITCIYLVTIGFVNNLRSYYNISDRYNDDDLLCKYGLTNNLLRRCKEHQRDYGRISGSSLHLKYFTHINEKKLFFAENILKDIFYNLDYKFDDYPGKHELVIIPKNKLQDIKKEYDRINLFIRKNDYIYI